MGIEPTDTAARELRDRLRSMPQQPSAFVVPLAAMVFLRWADFQEAEAEAMAAFDEIDHKPLLPASLHWRCWHDLPAGELAALFSEKLPSAIRRLEGSHDPLAASLVRLLPAIRTLAELSPPGIAALAGWLALQPFETPNDRRILLDQFDAFLDQVNGRETGEFRTPACINALLAALAAPEPGEHLYDPCFGFAGNLFAACRRVSQAKPSGHPRHTTSGLRVSGMELNANSYAVGLARLVLMGLTDARLEIGNSLERESNTSPRTRGYDCVIANPPWGQRIETRGMNHFPVQTNDGTSLFIQHALSQLRPNGRAVIVVPQGFLFQQGKTAAVRRWLLENHQVEAVVSLPEGAFLPHTSIKAAILILRRDGGPTKKVRMVDGTAFFEPSKGRSKAATIPAKKIEELAYAAEQSNQNSWDLDSGIITELGHDLSVTRREASELEKRLQVLGADIPLVSLGEIVTHGEHKLYRPHQLQDHPPEENPVPYIRIGDIKKGEILKPSTWLTESATTLASRHRLRAGDIVLSRSGTIGKVAIVRNGSVGAVVSGGLYVLKPDTDRIDPHFLCFYLQSHACLEWIKSRSSGSTIDSLTWKHLAELPVPLPALMVQARAVHVVREKQTDLLGELEMILNHTGANELSRWLDRGLSLLADAPNQGVYRSAPFQEIIHGLFGPDFRLIRNQIAHGLIPQTAIDPKWLLSVGKVAELLRDLATVPEGISQFSLLQRAEYELRSAESQITSQSPINSRIIEMTRRLGAILAAQREKLLGKVAVVVELKTNSLRAGTRGEITLEITNDGALPLHNFTLRCPEWSMDLAPFHLPENDIREITVEVDAPKVPGHHQMRIEWNATTLEGQPEAGTVMLALIIEARTERPQVVDLGGSPFFHGPPVGPDRNDVFFGRDLLISRIKAQIQSGNTVLLEGNRRSGKSSILKHLEGKDVIPGWLAVFADFQGAEGAKKTSGMPNEAIWRFLAKCLASALAKLEVPIPLPDGTILPPGTRLGVAEGCRNGISSEAPWEDFAEYFEVILELVNGLNLGLVLMIDEFDKLQEGIDNGVTSPQIPENIRFLIQSHSRFVAILTGSRRMQRLRHEYWSALYGLGNRVGVTALDHESARKLVTEPVKGKITYTDEAVDQIIRLTARQPYLIQYLCNRIFEMVSHLGQRSVGKKMVEEAAESFVRDNEHFASLWDFAQTDRRRFLIDICHRYSAGPDPVTFGFLQEQLTNEGIEISDGDLDGDLKFLQELEVIDFAGVDGGGVYRLTVPLMGQWIDQQQEYAALRDKARKEQENTQ